MTSALCLACYYLANPGVHGLTPESSFVRAMRENYLRLETRRAAAEPLFTPESSFVRAMRENYRRKVSGTRDITH